jgi:hypothetical protein
MFVIRIGAMQLSTQIQNHNTPMFVDTAQESTLTFRFGLPLLV